MKPSGASSEELSLSFLEKDLPDYKFQSVLGSGSTATVYRSTYVPLGRDVAIKRFSPEIIGKDAELLKRFQREAAMWAHFNHENLIHLYDFKATKSAHYIIVEYCQGLELKELLKQSPKLPLDIVACILYQFCEGLQYLHRNGIVHRDLKPANTFVKNDGVIKIMDFGISLCVELEPITATGAVMGTPVYMSPEQATGKKTNHKSDLFSLGVMAFEMLEGRKPFVATNFADLIKEISSGKYLKLSSKLPRKWRNFIYQCLEAQPNKRHASAQAMKAWLDDYFHRERISPRQHLQDFLVQKKYVKPPQGLFPKELLNETLKGPLSEAFTELVSDRMEGKSSSWFLKLFLGFGLLLALGILALYAYFFLNMMQS